LAGCWFFSLSQRHDTMIVSKLVILCVLAAVIVASVRFLVVPGIDSLSRVFGLSGKVRGQLLGYATSTPELVIIVASAASGVFDAGFWNIASSNIINWVLFMSAVLFWGQFKDLKKRPWLWGWWHCLGSTDSWIDVGMGKPARMRARH
jgi:Ca2+/Na+ antiporter